MTQFYWIVGSPRSGSSFLCDYIGKYTDKKYNEPWQTHHIETPRSWIFPKVKNIVFKYCENWQNFHVLANLYPKSTWIHVWRDPDNTVYSMANCKPNSNPPRNLYGGYTGEDRLRLCMQRWYYNTMHCLALCNIIPHQYIEIRYEQMKDGLERLSEVTNLPFNFNHLEFENRNDDTELDWNLNPTARQLRNLVKKFDGNCLAKWINKTKPNLLKRVVI